MVVGAGLGDGTGAVLHYRSDDLHDWSYDGVLTRVGAPGVRTVLVAPDAAVPEAARGAQVLVVGPAEAPAEVDAALAQLPPAQRTAFQLTFYHDMSYTDIADIMDCPVNTIKTRLFHARKGLATLLDHPLENRP